MTLEEEMQQYGDGWYAAEDTTEEAARTRNKYHKAATASFSSMFYPSKDEVIDFYLPRILSIVIKEKLILEIPPL